MNLRRKTVLSVVMIQMLYTLLHFARPTASIPIDNEIVGSINITCLESGISVNFKTKNTFHGRVYLRGPTAPSDCPTEVGQIDDAGVVILPFTDCNVQKESWADDSGERRPISMVIISFHPLGIITEADRAFNVECRNQNFDLMLTQSFEVSMLPTEAGGIFRPSQASCTYTIRARSLQGPIVKFANIGDTVFHIWECRNDKYTMLVHSCFASSSNQSEIPLVDQSGCSMDRYIISNLTYSKNMMRAYASADVFKFMDLSNLSFKCNVELCSKTDNNCTKHTPPACANIEQPNDDNKERKSRDAPNWPSFTSPIIVKSQEMFVNGVDENVDDFVTKSNKQRSLRLFAGNSVPVEREPVDSSYDALASWCTQSNLTVMVGLVSISAIVSFLFGLVLSHYFSMIRVRTCQPMLGATSSFIC